VIGRARVYDALRNIGTDAHLNDSLAIDIGRRLGATWVVLGGFQRIGPQIRITASFVEVASAMCGERSSWTAGWTTSSPSRTGSCSS
jgi:hypothetical protein